MTKRGGEFILSFLSAPEYTAAIDFKTTDGGCPLHFENHSFDIVTNRYEKYSLLNICKTVNQKKFTVFNKPFYFADNAAIVI